jgi:hypothetical protein
MEGGMIGDVVRRVADMVDEEAAKACEACRKDMAGRLMPDGLSWPIVDGQPVDFVTGYEPSLGVLEAVSIYSNGACEVMSHDGIIKGVKEIHVEKPKVLDAELEEENEKLRKKVAKLKKRCRALAERERGER